MRAAARCGHPETFVQVGISRLGPVFCSLFEVDYEGNSSCSGSDNGSGVDRCVSCAGLGTRSRWHGGGFMGALSGFHGGGHYGGYYGGRFYGGYYGGYYGGFYGGPFWWPLWWPVYAPPIYYAPYMVPYYTYPSVPPYVSIDPPPPPATQCYAPKVDQSGKAIMRPDYSKPVPCPTTQ